MIVRDDFEYRLSDGLKRWAEAGEPTLNLEAYVLGQPEGSVESPVQEPVQRRHLSPRWRVRLAAAAAVFLLLAGGAATFPRWAVAASQWPLVGPVLTEIILKDAGLKWAYENNAIKGTMAEAKLGDVTVRILGVMADARRTTVIYQVIGLPYDWDKPQPANGIKLEPPPASERFPEIRIQDPQSVYTTWGQTLKTSVGVVGTFSANPLPTADATLKLVVRYQGQERQLEVMASRRDTDLLTHAVRADNSQTTQGVTVTLEQVTYTPAEIVVQYRENQPAFFAPFSLDPKLDQAYLQGSGGQYQRQTESMGTGGLHETSFPRVDGNATFVLPMVVKVENVDLRWPLAPGTTQTVGRTEVTLQSFKQEDGFIELVWSNTPSGDLAGFGLFVLEDADGRIQFLDGSPSSTGLRGDPKGVMYRSYTAPLPPDFQPVAIHARQVGWKVYGPWQFELPPAP